MIDLLVMRMRLVLHSACDLLTPYIKGADRNVIEG